MTVAADRANHIVLRADVHAIDRSRGITVRAPGATSKIGLDATGALVDDASRGALIAAIRAGQHAELELDAVTYRQKDGTPNDRGIRVATDQLEAAAASLVGAPMLVDHGSDDIGARIGTILTSSLTTHGGTGWVSIVQRMRIVKPEAVISVLDGTIDRFAVAFRAAPGAPVICTVHRTPVLTACRCYPLDVVDLGGKSITVEWEITKAVGVEVSAVNIPDVTGTRVRDVSRTLSAALSAQPDHHTEGAIMPPIHRSPAPLPPALASVAAQLGIDPERVAANAAMFAARRDGRGPGDSEPVAHADVAGSLAAQFGVDRAAFDANLARYRSTTPETPIESVARQLGADVATLLGADVATLQANAAHLGLSIGMPAPPVPVPAPRTQVTAHRGVAAPIAAARVTALYASAKQLGLDPEQVLANALTGCRGSVR